MAHKGSGTTTTQRRTPVRRPVLAPAARRLWRDGETLQLGLPGCAPVVLAGLDDASREVLRRLDGTRDRAQVLDEAAALGLGRRRAAELLELLDGAGLLAEAGPGGRSGSSTTPPEERARLQPDLASLTLLHTSGSRVLAARARRRVLVIGAGRVGAPLAALLAGAGIGTVDVVDDGTVRPADTGTGGAQQRDIGRNRGAAARDLVRGLAPSAEPGAPGLPDLVLLAPTTDSPDSDDPVQLAARRVPHLYAGVQGVLGVVGPLVVPGRSACLQCLDLCRGDIDPDWPRLAVQLAQPGRQVLPCDGMLAVAVAAHAALQAVQWLDGEPAAVVGGTLELCLPDWRWRRRSWQRHPACECAWQECA